jgi:hypothetical protein
MQGVKLECGMLVLGRDPGVADVHPHSSEKASEYNRFGSPVSREGFERWKSPKDALLRGCGRHLRETDGYCWRTRVVGIFVYE